MRKMNIRYTCLNDLEQICAIYAYAREQMRKSGNPNQWNSHYPSIEILKEDIRNQNSYVILDQNDIIAVFTFILGDDPTYAKIEHGAWLNNQAYGTIHRIASSGKKQGMFHCCLSFCRSKIDNIRIDTHACNYTMQHLLMHSGFQKCGQIYTQDGSPRIAYQLSNSNTASTPSS